MSTLPPSTLNRQGQTGRPRASDPGRASRHGSRSGENVKGVQKTLACGHSITSSAAANIRENGPAEISRMFVERSENAS